MSGGSRDDWEVSVTLDASRSLENGVPLTIVRLRDRGCFEVRYWDNAPRTDPRNALFSLAHTSQQTHRIFFPFLGSTALGVAFLCGAAKQQRGLIAGGSCSTACQQSGVRVVRYMSLYYFLIYMTARPLRFQFCSFVDRAGQDDRAREAHSKGIRKISRTTSTSGNGAVTRGCGNISCQP